MTSISERVKVSPVEILKFLTSTRKDRESSRAFTYHYIISISTYLRERKWVFTLLTQQVIKRTHYTNHLIRNCHLIRHTTHLSSVKNMQPLWITWVSWLCAVVVIFLRVCIDNCILRRWLVEWVLGWSLRLLIAFFKTFHIVVAKDACAHVNYTKPVLGIIDAHKWKFDTRWQKIEVGQINASK